MSVRPTRVRRLRIRRAMGNAALVGVVLVAGGVYVAVQKTVTLIVGDDRPEAVRTMSASVGDLLDAEGVVVGLGDLVTPPTMTALYDGMTVVVDRGITELTVSGGPQDVGVWVMDGATTSQRQLATWFAEDWFSADGRAGRSPVVFADVVVKGKDHDVITNAGTVRELLSAMGIAPDEDDRVSPSLKTPLHDGLEIRFDEIRFVTRDVRLPVPYTTYSRFTDALEPGEIQYIRAGVDGLMVEHTRFKLVNGRAVKSVVLSRRVLEEAIAAKRLVGRDHAIKGTQVGEASWYGFAPGDGLTAAHPWLPFGTVVTVTNLGNGRSVQVVINDRGPFGGRIIDLSDEAFAEIAPLSQGVCQVRLTW